MKAMFNFGTPLNVDGIRFKNRKDRAKIQDKYAETFVN